MTADRINFELLGGAISSRSFFRANANRKSETHEWFAQTGYFFFV